MTPNNPLLPSSSSYCQSELSPGLSLSNIKNDISLVLDREKVHYFDWVELFEIHCHAYDVLDHIDPTKLRPANMTGALWQRLDSVVKKWNFGTISSDLLQAILYRGSTAQETWDRLKSIFQDNKHTRAVYLENQFNALHLSYFSDITTYCQQLKNLHDQLSKVDQDISNQKLFLRLVVGLVYTDFDTVASMIQQTKPLPSFKITRSRLLPKESRRANDPSLIATSFVATSTESASSNTLPQ